MLAGVGHERIGEAAYDEVVYTVKIVILVGRPVAGPRCGAML